MACGVDHLVVDADDDQGASVESTSTVTRCLSTRAQISCLAVGLWGLSVALAFNFHGQQHWERPTAWSPWVALPILAILFALTETFVVHLRIRSDAHTISLVELPLALGLFFAQPLVLIGAQILGAGSALVLHRRQGPLKLLFNTALLASTTASAITVYRLLSSGDERLGQRVLLYGAAALLVEALLSVVLVFVVISISAKAWQPADFRSAVGFGLVTAAFTVSLAIIAVVVVDAQAGIAWILIVPTAGTYLANWSYTTQRRRHEGLDFLYQSTKLLHQSPELELAIVDLLRHACATFNAGASQLVYVTESSDDPMSIRVGPGDLVESMQILDGNHRVLMTLLADRQACIIKPSDGPLQAEFLGLNGYESAIVAPMIGEHRLMGALVIANRLSQVVSFDSSDVQLAETLANHTTTALENGRLEQSLDQLRVLEGRLTFQALHDPLTGLANRTLFRTHLSETIDRRLGSPGAVLFIDLDDFKTINDSFGHAAGDALLIEVALRLSSCVAESDTIARLGGDEFAILLGTATEEDATLVAERILKAFEAPTASGSRMLDIRASIGVALLEPGTDPEAMMRNADTAMYIAKAQGKHCIVTFEHSMYESNMRRYHLHSELQSAIARGELEHYYQPIVRLGSHELLGVEALIRWNHPTLGLLTPDSFLQVAKETALIQSIDMSMMNRACGWLAAADIADPGLVPWVNVNLSPSSFSDPNLIEEVVAILQHHGVHPSRLGIEVTEDLMADHAESVIETLERLKVIGLRLALDDFGTGYSSLSRLRFLPIDVIKIAKPFVDDIQTSDSQRDFITAIVSMGGALDKFVVAEGVERFEQEQLLMSTGCQAGQGYLFAGPMDGKALLAWARRSKNKEDDRADCLVTRR